MFQNGLTGTFVIVEKSTRVKRTNSNLKQNIQTASSVLWRNQTQARFQNDLFTLKKRKSKYP